MSAVVRFVCELEAEIDRFALRAYLTIGAEVVAVRRARIADRRYDLVSDRLQSLDTGGSMAPVQNICTDPSHPPIVQGLGQETLYKVVLEKVLAHRKAGVAEADIVHLVSVEVSSILSRPWDSVYEAGRLQSMRRQIAREWGGVLCQLDNLGH